MVGKIKLKPFDCMVEQARKTRKSSEAKTITRTNVLRGKSTENSSCLRASANSQVTYNLILKVMHW